MSGPGHATPMRVSEHPLPVFRRPEADGHDTCARCPSLCRSECPVADVEGRETVAPKHLMAVADGLAGGRIAPSGAEALAWACTGCGACEEVCLHDNEVPFWLLLARARARDAGAAPQEAAEAAAAFGVAGNAFGTSLEEAVREVVTRARTRPARVPRDLYLPSCSALHALPDVPVVLLRAARVRGLGELALGSASGHCCGAPLAWAGELEGFRAHALRYAVELEAARRVVVHDPACAHTLRVLYPRVGVRIRPEVMSVPAFVRDRWVGPEGPEAGPRYAWLEPCHLGRGLGERASTRALLDAVLGARWAPLDRAGLGDCCGAAGLLPQTRPGTARRLAQLRVEAFRASGQDRLLTCAPRCAAHLREVDPELPVDDIGILLIQPDDEELA